MEGDNTADSGAGGIYVIRNEPPRPVIPLFAVVTQSGLPHRSEDDPDQIAAISFELRKLVTVTGKVTTVNGMPVSGVDRDRRHRPERFDRQQSATTRSRAQRRARTPPSVTFGGAPRPAPVQGHLGVDLHGDEEHHRRRARLPVPRDVRRRRRRQAAITVGSARWPRSRPTRPAGHRSRSDERDEPEVDGLEGWLRQRSRGTATKTTAVRDQRDAGRHAAPDDDHGRRPPPGPRAPAACRSLRGRRGERPDGSQHPDQHQDDEQGDRQRHERPDPPERAGRRRRGRRGRRRWRRGRRFRLGLGRVEEGGAADAVGPAQLVQLTALRARAGAEPEPAAGAGQPPEGRVARRRPAAVGGRPTAPRTAGSRTRAELVRGPPDADERRRPGRTPGTRSRASGTLLPLRASAVGTVSPPRRAPLGAGR